MLLRPCLHQQTLPPPQSLGSLLMKITLFNGRNYGSDINDIPTEDKEDSSSTANSQSAVNTSDRVTGSRRPCEEDPNPSSSKRSRNEEETKPQTPVTPTSPYTLDILSSMRIHPTYYVKQLKPYPQHESFSLDGSQRTTKRRPAIQVPLGCSTQSKQPPRPAPFDSAAPAASGRTPRSGSVPGWIHDRAERESHGQPGVDRTEGIFPPPPLSGTRVAGPAG
ncbi:hypothetical protein PC123_g24150 [Phytophthora cactorum]|nr:hypothetical protein PC120_g26317 [Phytophthora cactorum]KAG4040308.1 hypothetical protein PC123_g24150 [Phytophthora cactorum]